jgi:N-methylhydantoinase B
LKTELIDGSGGRGFRTGGMGIRREYQILDHTQHATFYAEQTNPEFVAQGRNGGENGQPSKLTLIDPNGQIVPIPSKVSMDLEPGSMCCALKLAAAADLANLPEIHRIG